MAMAQFADRFRRRMPTPETAVARAPASLLSVEPDDELDPVPEPVATPAPVAADAPIDNRPALLRKLAGEDSKPKKRFGLLAAAKGDDTILAATPSRPRALRAPRIGQWLGRLTGEGTTRDAPPRDALIDDAFEDIRREMNRSAEEAPAGDLHEAERRLTLALSKAGRLAEEIARCNTALEEARGLIRDEELKLARLRGLHEGIAGPTDTDRADLDAIQQTLETLRRMVDRLDEPR